MRGWIDMPFIKKIEVNGFKTFGKRTMLVFDKGFTAITGPNGSGKTNIIDAVLFALGEMSARKLRATNFSSLIFHGGLNSHSRKKKAKVIIQFDNSDGRLPLDTTTVTVSREIDQEGRSIYRINGRKVSRSYAIEILSMAGITPNGHNVILQGTLTRLSEISSQERRRIIEDAIGIAQYDYEKAEAQKKLDAANIAIKTAMGQVGEVQKRIESLERERNDLLRYNFIREEIKQLEAIKLSRRINDNQKEIDELSEEISDLKGKLEELRRKREELRSKRRQIESDLRRFSLEQSKEKQNQILQIQIRIGELRSRLGELNSKISSGKSILEDLRRSKIESERQIGDLRNEIKECERKIEQLALQRGVLVKEIAEKQSIYDALSSELDETRSKLEEKNKEIREAERFLEQIRTEAMKIQSEQAKSRSKVDVYSERLKNLEEEKKDLNLSLKKLEEAFKDLQSIQKEQKAQLEALRDSLARRTKRKSILETQIKEVGRVAESAREAVVEFEARKELVERFNTEERSLQYIEELSREGLIEGVHGRLRDFVRFSRRYERAVEAAASGWLNSLVVDDLDVAFTCVEMLKKTKLGRIKIVPLRGLSRNKRVNLPKGEGVLGVISDFVKCDERYAPAVSFVLGDTLLVKDENTALTVSRRGFRSVTPNGDIFEAGGGVESGFYRAPLDFSSFVPSESSLRALDKAVAALKKLLAAREGHIQELEDEIAETQKEITRLSQSLGRLGSEIERVRKSIHEARINLNRAESNLKNIHDLLQREESLLKQYEDRWNELSKREAEIQQKLSEMKKKIDLTELQERDGKRGEIGNEIVTLKQKASSIEANLSSLQSRVEMLKKELENAISRRDKATSRISSLEGEIKRAYKSQEETQAEIEKLEKEKGVLSNFLLNVRKDAEKLTFQIDEIDGKLQAVEEEYERIDALLDETQLNLQTLNLQMRRYFDQLKSLGYEKPLSETLMDIKKIDETLGIMRSELNQIGAVNQLASKQYEEQISRYKELSIRMNELEKERMAIVKFIEEIEQKKYNVFREAFNRVNERLDRYFSKLTGGGNAALKLENPKAPFSGGVDMVVQFVGKPPILVSGASSGERSVAAVAFLFALQEFTPASFYLFDEIDAHLDAFHVERLGELLAEEADKSQFIVVTLKPEMVSKADRIYGVYGREGVSHVVSTTFKGVSPR
ncbi:TPA: chromosome segregation protein SMC [Candidatus Bathyarchaeota archaeon]|nr:chromosome segregation protein SMC [Candidatus Bathyarchaeota archaeon]